MEHFWIFAAFILAIVYVFDRSVLRFDLKAFAWFLKVLIIGSIISIVLNSLVGRFPPLPLVPVSSLLFVWWEDVLFSLLSIYYAKKFLPKYLYVPVIFISSIIFGLGHLYQGWFAAIALSFYPYFVSYRYGKKHGHGTIMAMHVVYDLSVYASLSMVHFIRGVL